MGAGSPPTPDYLRFLAFELACSFTVVSGWRRTVVCFTNLPVIALRPRLPPDPLEELRLAVIELPRFDSRIALTCTNTPQDL